MSSTHALETTAAIVNLIPGYTPLKSALAPNSQVRCRRRSAAYGATSTKKPAIALRSRAIGDSTRESD
jgi:hypothetical protein